jgi:hypothetical protein
LVQNRKLPSKVVASSFAMPSQVKMRTPVFAFVADADPAASRHVPAIIADRFVLGRAHLRSRDERVAVKFPVLRGEAEADGFVSTPSIDR